MPRGAVELPPVLLVQGQTDVAVNHLTRTFRMVQQEAGPQHGMPFEQLPQGLLEHRRIQTFMQREDLL